MITSTILQNEYVNLYEEMRKYIWPRDVVSELAGLEIEVYKSFPDVEVARKHYNNLKLLCKEVTNDDEKLDEAFEDFNSSLNEANSLYAKLDLRKEA